ncbi:hypothetical protein LSH36_913g01063 [Paralvinella palmiformis]|uniref:Metalloendopeptidase n=1 Tax=Paralvinella palmiformis TaxID=53620 RepID=A0AAD9IYA0_9ANNE|nr:hypothetical protein LSH36_913g01063 [Paralvinella palmiformis]
MRRSERRNNLQICPGLDSNTGGSDLWSSTLPLDHGGAPYYCTWPVLRDYQGNGSRFRDKHRGRRYPSGKPDDMTLKELFETRGQGRTKHENIRRMADHIRRRFLKPGQTLPDKMDDKFDDLVFTEDQLRFIDQLFADSQAEVGHSNKRQKRKVINFGDPGIPFNKWETTNIHYMIDGTQSMEQQADIVAAMDHWAEKTCLRFVEAPSDVDTIPYIYITKDENEGCWSYIGRVTNSGPQILNLASDCFLSDGRIGTIIHELGHALGFVHEHTRDDRDVYVTINEDNILSGLETQFTLWQIGWLNPDTLTKAAYDMSSVMHYSAKAFSNNNDYTITANNPLYAGNMGQRRYLTFWDAYAANEEYCSDACNSKISCRRGGYQDPKECDSCICPEGFTGQYCGTEQANTAVCPDSGHMDIGLDPLCIDVQLYSSSNNQLKCDWHIQAASGCTIDFWFEKVNLACSAADRSCHDYVEVRYADKLAIRGPRFCCTAVPDAINGTLGKYQTSETNELLVNLDSVYSAQGYMPSFKLCLKLLCNDDYKHANDNNTNNSNNIYNYSCCNDLYNNYTNHNKNHADNDNKTNNNSIYNYSCCNDLYNNNTNHNKNHADNEQNQNKDYNYSAKTSNNKPTIKKLTTTTKPTTTASTTTAAVTTSTTTTPTITKTTLTTTTKPTTTASTTTAAVTTSTTTTPTITKTTLTTTTKPTTTASTTTAAVTTSTTTTPTITKTTLTTTPTTKITIQSSSTADQTTARSATTTKAPDSSTTRKSRKRPDFRRSGRKKSPEKSRRQRGRKSSRRRAFRRDDSSSESSDRDTKSRKH